MNGKLILIGIVGIIFGFIGGFMFANSLNKNELDKRLADRGSSVTDENQDLSAANETTLSDEEIKSRIAEADQNPTNFDFQKQLGSALYQYGAMKRDAPLLGEVARLLTRVYQNDPKDRDVMVALGNVYFDIAYINKENENYLKSREFYEAALKDDPNDAEVRMYYGLTFYLIAPSQTAEAIAEFERSLKIDPNHEKTLQLMADAHITLNKRDEAIKYAERLEIVNPENAFLRELKARMSAEAASGTQNK